MAAQTGADSAAVRALAVIGSDLYVGGDFIKNWAATLSLNRIARYDTIGQAWHPLAENGIGGASSNVFALAVSGSDLYVGGLFIQTTDNTTPGLNATARYSGGAWSALAENGLKKASAIGVVYALAVSPSGDLYVGGDFIKTIDNTTPNLNFIARYSGGVWSALNGHGLDSIVRAIAVTATDLYAGGEFSAASDSSVTALFFIARHGPGTTAVTLASFQAAPAFDLWAWLAGWLR